MNRRRFLTMLGFAPLAATVAPAPQDASRRVWANMTGNSTLEFTPDQWLVPDYAAVRRNITINTQADPDAVVNAIKQYQRRSTELLLRRLSDQELRQRLAASPVWCELERRTNGER